ncbi:MAG: ACP S-malonyltransferase, partial [Planctomycetes bacterium]|nr:ACP S-malonyltransferase [Planctomycetota bacterium]
MAVKKVVILCPGQGAQAVGMGSDWSDASGASKAVFDEADEVLGDSLGESLSTICFSGPLDR